VGSASAGSVATSADSDWQPYLLATTDPGSFTRSLFTRSLKKVSGAFAGSVATNEDTDWQTYFLTTTDSESFRRYLLTASRSSQFSRCVDHCRHMYLLAVQPTHSPSIRLEEAVGVLSIHSQDRERDKNG
jgi:hypothetical protein